MQPDHKFLGIEIGGTKLQLVKGDAMGRIEKKLRYKVVAANGREGICLQIKDGLRQLNAANDLVAAGVGFGGPVDTKTGTISVSHQVEGWDRFPLAQWLHAQTGTPV